jgi:hypothetical protein
VPGWREEGRQPGAPNERKSKPGAVDAGDGYGPPITTEVNVGVRSRTIFTAPSWSALIEPVEWPNQEVSRGYAL